MPRYEVYVHVDVMETLSKVGAQRRRILHFIGGLREDPDTPGNYTDRTSPARDQQVKIIRGYALTYWPDHAAKTVMIVGLKPAND